MSCAMPLAIWPSARSRSCSQRRLLRALQVFVGLLQRGVQLRLVGRQRDVLAELAQEFALAAAEGLRRAPRHHQHGEHAAALLQHQRHDHQRAQAGARQALRETETRRPRCRARRPAGRRRNAPGRSGRSRCAPASIIASSQRQRLAARARRASTVSVAPSASCVQMRDEIRRQVFLDAAHHHLEDAVEILAFGDGARDPAQQVEPFAAACSVRTSASCRTPTSRRRSALRVSSSAVRAGDARFERLVAHLEFMLDAHAARGVGGAHLHEAEQQEQAAREHAEMRASSRTCWWPRPNTA